MLELSDLQKEWLTEEKQRLEDDKKRRYLHFDPRIYTLTEQQATKILDPDYVVRNSFYPFVRDAQVRRRHKKVNGKKIIEKKVRPISYAAHADALIYSFYTSILNRSYEQVVQDRGISENVSAYRRTGKSTLDFASEVFELIKKTGDCVAICFDVKGFFDNLDHGILKNQWQTVLGAKRLPDDHFAIYKSITKFSYVEKEALIKELGLDKRKLGKMQRYCPTSVFHRKVRGGKIIQVNTQKGIPQGAPISAVLSNMYMLDFDVAVRKLMANIGGLYRRYCDDIIVVVPGSEKIESQKFVMGEVAKLNLEISAEKTETVEFKKDELVAEIKDTHGIKRLQYLGLEFDGKNIYLRHRGLASFQRRMAGGIRGAVAWAKNTNKGKVPKRRIYEKYSIYGTQNYFIYARRAAKKLNSATIAQQVRPGRVMRLLKSRIKKELGR
jgi:hypothetical protein